MGATERTCILKAALFTAIMSPHHSRSPTFPLYHSTRKKPRRWPLVLRFIKGAIHADIAIAVVLHALWAAIIVYIDRVRDEHIGLPSSIIPSLSIVVGLMLVFRNQTSYDRFWQACSQPAFPIWPILTSAIGQPTHNNRFNLHSQPDPVISYLLACKRQTTF